MTSLRQLIVDYMSATTQDELKTTTAKIKAYPHYLTEGFTCLNF